MGIELGVGIEEIEEAEKLLQIKFPGKLLTFSLPKTDMVVNISTIVLWSIVGLVEQSSIKEIWQVSNGLEVGEWRLFPIFSKKNPKKSWGHVVEENTNNRWEYRPKDLIAIAVDGSGDNLVLKIENGNASEIIYHWDHETNKASPSKQKLSNILALANKRVEKIKKQMEKNIKK